MSATFDYITGKKSGREAELEASLEHMGGHLGVEMDDNEKLRAEIGRLRDMVAALAPFLAIWAVSYQFDHELDGLHPVHYDLLAESGARMDSFTRATNAQH